MSAIPCATIARTGLVGRDKLGELRALALSRGWLDAQAELPDDASLAAAMAPRRRAASTVSSVEPLRSFVQHWFDAGVQGRAIHAALRREHGFTGSYSAVVRLLRTVPFRRGLWRRRTRAIRYPHRHPLFAGL